MAQTFLEGNFDMRIHALIVGLVLICAAEARGQDWVFRGDGLGVRIHDGGNGVTGELELNGQKYPFTGAVQGQGIAGNFQAGGKAFPFTLTFIGNPATKATLESQGTTYNLAQVPAGGGAAPNPGPAPVAPRPVAKPEQPANGPAPDITYAPQQLVDPKTRLAVATLMVPKGWQLDPGVLWRPMDAQFVSLQTAVFDPRTGWAVRWIPHDQFSFNQVLYDNAIQQQAPPRSIGGIEYTRTLPNALQYIQTIVLPRYRRIADLKVVAGEELPRLAQAIDQSQPYTRWLYQQGGREMAYTAARLRVEYTGPANAPVEEEIICVLNTSWSPQGIANARAVGMPGDYFFMPDRVFSYTAPKGQLNAAMPFLEPIVLSMRSDQTWTKFIDNIQGSVTAIVMDQYKIEEAARRQITASQRKSVEESWKSADTQSREVGALLSGTQARQSPFNPNGPPMNAPAGKVSWTNPRGEWRHLEPGDDPNTHPGSTQDWKIATTAKNQ